MNLTGKCGLLTIMLVLLIGSRGDPSGSKHAGQDRCTALAATELAGARILSVAAVSAGNFAASAVPDASGDIVQRMSGMPAFCRVQVRVTSAPTSDVRVELWLPLAGWNGRFLGTGNGGSAGSIAYGMGMIEGLKRGFAVANTDMGTGPDVAAAEALPERWKDFGHRATHEMTRVAKPLVRAFYKVAGFRSYFEGCSTGGQQGLSEAQRYPSDYDGILVGAPGGNRTHSTAYFLWSYQAVNSPAEGRMSAAQWQFVTASVIAACAGRDGGAPGDAYLTDPGRCRIDPGTLARCGSAGARAPECLTGPQTAALRRLYAGPVNPVTGERIYAGLVPGSEALPLGPGRMNDPAIVERLFILRWALGADAGAKTFDFDRDQDRLDARLSSTLNANDADLADFARRGGKLLLYNGLADPGVPYPDTVAYYERVLAGAGGESGRSFARLFLVPGMGHCFGGPGATDFGQPFSPIVPSNIEGDALMTLVRWTEHGEVPVRMVALRAASDGQRVRSERPLCIYPDLPEYRGGDPARRTSFACRPHPRGVEQVPATRYIN